MKAKNHRIFLFSVASILLVSLLNISELKAIHLESQQTKSTAIFDPSGYYNLAHNHPSATDQSNVAKDKRSTAFIMDFFGLPAIIYVLFFLSALKASGVVLTLTRKIMLFVFSWLIFEFTSYTMMIVGLFTLGFGVFVFPVLLLISLFVFLWMATRMLKVRFPANNYPAFIAGAIFLSLLPVLYIFKIDFNLPLMAVFYILFFQLLIGAYLDKTYTAKWRSEVVETENPGTLSS